MVLKHIKDESVVTESVLEIGYWLLFGIWILLFGNSTFLDLLVLIWPPYMLLNFLII